MKRLPIETFLGHFLKHPAALVGSKVSGILFLNTLSPAIVVDDRLFGKTWPWSPAEALRAFTLQVGLFATP
jgi:hypothetical protein